MEVSYKNVVHSRKYRSEYYLQLSFKIFFNLVNIMAVWYE